MERIGKGLVVIPPENPRHKIGIAGVRHRIPQVQGVGPRHCGGESTKGKEDQRLANDAMALKGCYHFVALTLGVRIVTQELIQLFPRLHPIEPGLLSAGRFQIAQHLSGSEHGDPKRRLRVDDHPITKIGQLA